MTVGYTLSTDQTSLQTPDLNNYWGSIKGELTYDNTRSLGLNLYNGTRYKIFGEYYQLINGANNNVIILGADFRHYEKIHRCYDPCPASCRQHFIWD